MRIEFRGATGELRRERAAEGDGVGESSVRVREEERFRVRPAAEEDRSEEDEDAVGDGHRFVGEQRRKRGAGLRAGGGPEDAVLEDERRVVAQGGEKAVARGGRFGRRRVARREVGVARKLAGAVARPVAAPFLDGRAQAFQRGGVQLRPGEDRREGGEVLYSGTVSGNLTKLGA